MRWKLDRDQRLVVRDLGLALAQLALRASRAFAFPLLGRLLGRGRGRAGESSGGVCRLERGRIRGSGVGVSVRHEGSELVAAVEGAPGWLSPEAVDVI